MLNKVDPMCQTRCGLDGFLPARNRNRNRVQHATGLSTVDNGELNRHLYFHCPMVILGRGHQGKYFKLDVWLRGPINENFYVTTRIRVIKY
ncbi:predicted protein [Plenodomus lingam JN3]|uniref:Predicted protein n=1 Tax=Leptosphaeria maculans (strain JN3 / isolate v23.1.3 / race Av1-4-5-6-7-8) TaxID=985895 RepID=E4ZPP8_LEPMJ|nr:predicted protein [Plenodomus lingam JN3]CBX93433.1 predicted protein [Plenodomus lingam JN3]